MFELVSLLFGWVLMIGAMAEFVLLQCGNKSRRAKKRSVKSAKSAKKSAKRSAKKVKESAKEGAEFVKEKAKEKAKSAKEAVKSKKPKRSSRSSSRGSANAPGPINALAAKAKSAKETVKEKLDISQSAQKSTKKSERPNVSHPTEELDANYQQKNLSVEPRELHFEQHGGFQKVHLHNPGVTRQAVKVKCSDNQLYRVSPVFGFIEPANSLTFDVLRQNGEPKPDKLVFLISEADGEAADPKAVFKSMAPGQSSAVVLPLKV